MPLSRVIAVTPPSKLILGKPAGRGRKFMNSAWFLLLLFVLFGRSAVGQVNVYTRDYDNSRTGSNTNETILTPSNVNSAQFGKLFTFNTDDEIYAQPLYVSNLTVGGATHNVVYVATLNNTLYALDADNGTLLWSRNFGAPINSSEVQVSPNVAYTSGFGILATPVIDPSTNFMYLVHGSEASSNGSPVYSYILEAIDITTGNEVLGAPVTIAGTYHTADLNGNIVFNAQIQLQRASLALANGNVYMGFASHNDRGPWRGWIMAYSASTLAQTGVYSTTTYNTGGGLWMAGSAPAIDAAGNLFFSSGNGAFGPTPNNLVQTGNSWIKLTPSLQLLDYFTPTNSATLNSADQDIGSSGILLVPVPGTNPVQTQYVVGGGKQGVLYLTSPSTLGKFNSSVDQVLQEFQAVYGYGTSHIHGTPKYFNSAANGPVVYVWGENDYLRGFQLNAPGGLFSTTPFAKSSMTAPTAHVWGAMPGGFLTTSSNNGSNGIVWASTPYLANSNAATVQGTVYAFNADTLQLLWDDKLNDARDEIGLFAKFVPPMVANGKVYVPSFGPVATGTTTAAGQLVVYGILPTLSVQVANATMTSGAALPAFSSSVTGLVNGDQVGTTLTITYSTTATSSSAPGAYPITATVSGSSASHYQIAISAGTLTVLSPLTSPMPPTINFPQGFTTSNIRFNGSAALNGSALSLTNGGTYQKGTAYYSTPVNIQHFSTNFQLQITNPVADGCTFIVQTAGLTALGKNGGNLGYAGIGNSVAIKFDLYNDNGEGPDSTGIYTNGAGPFTPAVNLSSTGINLHSGHIFNVQMTYSDDTNTLTVVFTDTVTNATATQTYSVNIPSIVGGSTAYVGFSGSTGGATAVQQVLSWTFTQGGS